MLRYVTEQNHTSVKIGLIAVLGSRQHASLTNLSFVHSFIMNSWLESWLESLKILLKYY